MSVLFLEQRAALMAGLGRILGKPRGWERVVRKVVPFEECHRLPERTLHREGRKVLANPAVPIGYHLLLFGNYEKDVRAVMRRYTPPGGVAIDVGSNVGWHTLLLSKLVGTGGLVLAVEANESIRRRLEEHLRMNHADNVRVVPFAMAARPQTLLFLGPDCNHPGAGDGHIAAADEYADPQTAEVEARTLDSVVEEHGCERVDFVKIDVEGFEWPVLQGAAKTIERFRPAIVFEYNAEYAARGSSTSRTFTDYFSGLGYELREILRSSTRALPKTDWPGSCNVLARPKQER